jgi:dTDP-4-amino-4,6-dideoxygalactose transaminase
MDKKIYVTRSSIAPFDEYMNEIKPIWENAFMTNMGKLHGELEKQLLEYLSVENISLFCNGHLALELILQAMNLKGEVITTPFTFASTTHAIVRNGLTPVFCDINLDDYTIDCDKIEELINEKTTAILGVHVYGNICNVKKIDEIAKKHNLKVIYDAAHAFGIKVNGISVGNFGHASMFSFHATKVFNTIEGGAVCYNDKKLGEKLYNLKNFGIQSEEIVEAVGANAKMNEFQAAMGICNLRHVNEEILKRKKVVERYRHNLLNVHGLKIMEPQEGIESNFSYFPIIINEEIFGYNRNDIYEKLKENNIFSRKYFYPLTLDFDCYREEFQSVMVPNARYISERVLTLPLYADLDISIVDHICNIIKDIQLTQN